MIGQTLSHYRIIAKLGAGGMGEVYSAHDERLEREVALKIIRSGALADEAARKRFRKEALALSKLNHPNIATIFDFDFDSESGVELIAMEYVPGETLAERARGGTGARFRMASVSRDATVSGNGCRPVVSSYSTAPSEKMSLRASTASSRNCSGDM